jgi:hypothetical protein
MRARLIITYALNLLDLIATTRLVQKYGIEIEANPIARWLYQTGAAYAAKIVGVGLLLLVLYHALKARPEWGWVSWLLLAVYGALALYHIFIALSIY